MPNPNYSYSGLADLYLKPYGSAGAARAVGSVSICQLSPQVDHKEQKNYGRAGGTLKTRDRVTGVGVKLTMQSLSVANLADALRGASNDVTSGAVINEMHVAQLDSLIRLDYINSTSLIVTDVPGTTTYALGEDYRVTGAGIVPLLSGSIADSEPLKISYSYSSQKAIEALVSGAKEYTLHFDGLNDADDNSNVVVDMWRLQIAVAKQLDLIGDDFATLEVDGSLLFDPTRPAGESPFFRWIYGSPNA